MILEGPGKRKNSLSLTLTLVSSNSKMSTHIYLFESQSSYSQLQIQVDQRLEYNQDEHFKHQHLSNVAREILQHFLHINILAASTFKQLITNSANLHTIYKQKKSTRRIFDNICQTLNLKTKQVARG